MEKLQSLISKNPDDPFPRYGLAMELRGLGRHEEAATAFAELLRKRPDYVAAYLHYGTVLTHLAETDRARQVIEKGMRLSLAGGDRHAYEELRSALQALDELGGEG